MRPVWTITADGESVTARLADYLISMSVTDQAGMESDELQIVVADPQAKIAWPRHGAMLDVSIGYDHTGPVSMGSYQVDAVEIASPPRAITIRAHAADMRGGLKTRRTRSWEDSTISAIVGDIAQSNGLTPKIDADMGKIVVNRWDQTNESDMATATRLASAYGALASVKAGSLVFAKRGAATAVSGAAIPPMTLRPQDVTTWRASLADQGQYSAVEARYYDRTTATETWTRSGQGEGDAVYRLRQTYPDQERAQAAADSKLAALERGKTALSITMPGQTSIAAETPLVLVEFGDGIDGEWVVHRAAHRVDSGGYSLSVDAERTPEQE